MSYATDPSNQLNLPEALLRVRVKNFDTEAIDKESSTNTNSVAASAIENQQTIRKHMNNSRDLLIHCIVRHFRLLYSPPQDELD